MKRDFLRHFPPDAQLNMGIVYGLMQRNWPRQIPNPFMDHTAAWEQFEEYKAERLNGFNQQFLKLPDVPITKLPSKRKVEQPIFKMQFDSLADAQMRLRSTLIFIGSYLYYVREVLSVDGEYLLVLDDKKGNRYKCWYKSEFVDLRTPEPQYITCSNHGPAYLLRHPHRQQKQGLPADVLYAKRVGEDGTIRPSAAQVMDGLTPDVFNWSPAFVDLIVKLKAVSAIRLSKYIAIYRDPKSRLCAEYRGRLLGKVEDDTVFVDEHDGRKPWIVGSAAAVGLNTQVR